MWVLITKLSIPFRSKYPSEDGTYADFKEYKEMEEEFEREETD